MLKKFKILCSLCLISLMTFSTLSVSAMEVTGIEPDAEEEIQKDLQEIHDQQEAYIQYINEQQAASSSKTNGNTNNSSVRNNTNNSTTTTETNNTDEVNTTDTTTNNTQSQYTLTVRARKIQPSVQKGDLSIACTITELMGYDENHPENDIQQHMLSSDYLHASVNYQQTYTLEANKYYSIDFGTYQDDNHFFEAYTPNSTILLDSDKTIDFIYGDEEFLDKNRSLYDTNSADKDAKLVKQKKSNAKDVENATQEINESTKNDSNKIIYLIIGLVIIICVVVVIFIIRRKRGSHFE